MYVRVMPECCKALNKIIVNFRSWRPVTDNEPFAGQILPINFLLIAKRVVARKNHSDALSP